MPNAKIPQKTAEITGAALRNPARYYAKFAPSLPPLGPPPAHLDEEERRNWKRFRGTMPWLRRSDEATVELACRVQQMTRANPKDLGAARLLTTLLSKLAATPIDQGKAQQPEPPAPPEDEFFGRD